MHQPDTRPLKNIKMATNISVGSIQFYTVTWYDTVRNSDWLLQWNPT